jgi:small-conductance mechanosensitive channel
VGAGFGIVAQLDRLALGPVGFASQEVVMEPEESGRGMSSDQKRALLILVIIAVLIAVVAIGIAYLATSIGVPLWIAAVVAIVIAAVVGLFMFLNLS